MCQRATVLFTDESRFSLTRDSHSTFIRKEPRPIYLVFNIQEIDHYGSGGLMVWTGITDAVNPDFTLVDDKWRPHRVHLVDEFLETEYKRRMD
ncbi:transposable element Tcb2 transposase [Trichonephila clavipes]|nr:transposable element Tcb2 transposase [Trichonephila clavipes]